MSLLGTVRLIRKINNMASLVEKAAMETVKVGAVKIEGDAKTLIQRGSRTGVTTKSTKGGRAHKASAAGEPPKTDSGQLVRNITSEVKRGGKSATVGSRTPAPHGLFLEFGTTHISPRPWLRPTYTKNIPFINKTFKKNAKLALRKVINGR